MSSVIFIPFIVSEKRSLNENGFFEWKNIHPSASWKDSTKVFPLSPKNQHFHSHTFYTSITKIKLSLYRYKKLQINSISYPSDKINYKSTSLRLKILKHFQKTPNFHPTSKVRLLFNNFHIRKEQFISLQIPFQNPEKLDGNEQPNAICDSSIVLFRFPRNYRLFVLGGGGL